jgi:hypothetical protein
MLSIRFASGLRLGFKARGFDRQAAAWISPAAGADDPLGLKLVRAPGIDLKELIHLHYNADGALVLRIELHRLEELASRVHPTHCMQDLGSAHMIVCQGTNSVAGSEYNKGEVAG